MKNIFPSCALLFASLLATSLALPAFAGAGQTMPEITTDFEKLEQFSDWRFGVMVHASPATLLPVEISWGMTDRKAYEATYKVWNPKKLDMNTWATIAETAGAKYAMFICKHHDGFCFWPTQTTDKNIMNGPLKRDLVKEYMAAFKAHGVYPGTYISIMDVIKQDSAGVDDTKMPAGGLQAMVDYADAQIGELMNNYGSDLFWFDGYWFNEGADKQEWKSKEWNTKYAPMLYSRMKARNPHILTNKLVVMPKNGEDGQEKWDPAVAVGDSHVVEGRVSYFMPYAWETVTSVAYPLYSWAPNLKFQSPEQCIRLLASCACRNSNLMLSFIPDADGEISQEQVVIAQKMGAFLKVNGKGIYSTRGGPWYPTAWGGSTHHLNKIYVHAFDEAPQRLLLPAIEARIGSATTLSGQKIEWSQNEKGEVALTLPKEVRSAVDTVIELTTDRLIATTPMSSNTQRSVFEDPIYGKVISEDASLALSSVYGVDKVEDHAKLFKGDAPASGFSFHTAPELAPSITIDLGKEKMLTGISIVNRPDAIDSAEGLTLELSKDGKTWKEMWKASKAQAVWEVTLADFYDHTTVQQGENARYIKIISHHTTPQCLHLKQIKVYGTEK